MAAASTAKKGTLSFLLGTLFLAGLPAGTASAEGGLAMVTAMPEETDELLANPGIGWQAFHLTKARDKNLQSGLAFSALF